MSGSQGSERDSRGFPDGPPRPTRPGRSPNPRKHISSSTKSRCARRLGSQSAGSAPGTAAASLPASSGPSARSPRASSSSSSMAPAGDREARAAASPVLHRVAQTRAQTRLRARDRGRSRDAAEVTPGCAHVITRWAGRAGKPERWGLSVFSRWTTCVCGAAVPWASTLLPPASAYRVCCRFPTCLQTHPLQTGPLRRRDCLPSLRLLPTGPALRTDRRHSPAALLPAAP